MNHLRGASPSVRTSASLAHTDDQPGESSSRRRTKPPGGVPFRPEPRGHRLADDDHGLHFRPVRLLKLRPRRISALGAPGRVAIAATTGGATAEMTLDVQPNLAARISLTPDRSAVQTGNVTRLTTTVTDAEGRTLDDLAVAFSVSAITDAMASGGPSSGLITQDGRFVGDLPGAYSSWPAPAR